ncbi:MAG TPA: alpha/beta fold hydrolase [Parafilimonas sp.]|nr:alpha/beta fold hydrolase [Parafilimonas sp.]
MRKILKWIARVLLILFIVINAICAWQAFIFTHFSQEKISKNQEQQSIIPQKLSRIFGKKHARQLVIDSLRVQHESLFITSGTLKLASWYLKHNPDTTKNGTVIMFHGYGSSRSDIIPEATAFYKMQYDVLMIDFRAHGNSEGNVCSMGYHEAGDVKSAYNFISNTGEKNIILWGGSMGAASITKAMHDDYSIKPSKIILEKCFGRMTDAANALARNSTHEPARPFGTLLTFWASVELGTYLFNLNPQQYAKEITCPVLIQWGGRDENVSRQETESIYNNLGSSKKKLAIYPDCGHENLLLKQPVLWRNSVSNFLNSQ